MDKTIRLRGKKWVLPEVLGEGDSVLGAHYFWEALDYRFPKQGEYFVSGAIPEIYKAPNDLSHPYLVITLLREAKRKSVWI